MNSYQLYELDKLFNSIDSKHQIKISIIDNIAWFNINKLDYSSCKTFLLLLKDVMEFISVNNIEYIKQYILMKDLEYFKNSSFVEIDNGQCVVSTNIIHFLSEITNVLGIKKL